MFRPKRLINYTAASNDPNSVTPVTTANNANSQWQKDPTTGQVFFNANPASNPVQTHIDPTTGQSYAQGVVDTQSKLDSQMAASGYQNPDKGFVAPTGAPNAAGAGNQGAGYKDASGGYVPTYDEFKANPGKYDSYQQSMAQWNKDTNFGANPNGTPKPLTFAEQQQQATDRLKQQNDVANANYNSQREMLSAQYGGNVAGVNSMYASGREGATSAGNIAARNTAQGLMENQFNAQQQQISQSQLRLKQAQDDLARNNTSENAYRVAKAEQDVLDSYTKAQTAQSEQAKTIAATTASKMDALAYMPADTLRAMPLDQIANYFKGTQYEGNTTVQAALVKGYEQLWDAARGKDANAAAVAQANLEKIKKDNELIGTTPDMLTSKWFMSLSSSEQAKALEYKNAGYQFMDFLNPDGSHTVVTGDKGKGTIVGTYTPGGTSVTNSNDSTGGVAGTYLNNITQNFGAPVNYEKGGTHHGLDVSLPGGKAADVLAPVSGTVTLVPDSNPGEKSGYGNRVMITDAQGNQHYLSHLSAFEVQDGEHINMGQAIGKQGNTGYTIASNGGDGTHVDYEIKDPNGNYKDPKQFLTDLAAPKFERYGLLANTNLDLSKETDTNAISYLDAYFNSSNGQLPSAASMFGSARGNNAVKFEAAQKRAKDLYADATGGQTLPDLANLMNNKKLIATNNKVLNTQAVTSEALKKNFDLAIDGQMTDDVNKNSTLINKILNPVYLALGDPATNQALVSNGTITQEFANLISIRNQGGTLAADKEMASELMRFGTSLDAQKAVAQRLQAEAINIQNALKDQNNNLWQQVDPLQRQSNNPLRQKSLDDRKIQSLTPEDYSSALNDIKGKLFPNFKPKDDATNTYLDSLNNLPKP